MHANNASIASDLQKIDATTDEQIDFSDLPETTPEQWAESVVHRGLPVPEPKHQIAIRIDANVLAWFKDQGPGWQTRMNAVLKAYVDAQRR